MAKPPPLVESERPLFTMVTRDGVPISVYGQPRPDEEVAYYATTQVEQATTRYENDALMLSRRSADSNYNCHGLTLMSRHGYVGVIPGPLIRGGMSNQPEDTTALVEKLLSNSGYRLVLGINYQVDQIRDVHNIDRGDIIVYRQDDKISHTGIVWCCRPPRVRILSKLGDAGEYFHDFDKLPDNMYGFFVEFWSDRGVRRYDCDCLRSILLGR